MMSSKRLVLHYFSQRKACTKGLQVCFIELEIDKQVISKLDARDEICKTLLKCTFGGILKANSSLLAMKTAGAYHCRCHCGVL